MTVQTTREEISMSEELISYIDQQINTKRETKTVGALSNYQNAISKANFQKVFNNDGPAMISAGSNAGGYTQYNYYKNKNNEIYILEFYVQEFECYYKIEKEDDSWKICMFGLE
jgi:hypothetical protein